MGLMGPGRSTGKHTAQAQKDRQTRAKLDDANASTQTKTVTVQELRNR